MVEKFQMSWELSAAMAAIVLIIPLVSVQREQDATRWIGTEQIGAGDSFVVGVLIWPRQQSKK